VRLNYDNFNSLGQYMKDNIYSLFSERLKKERTRLGLSQASAGDTCKVSREMWGKYERGEASPGGEVLSTFAAAGADVQYILTGQPNPLLSLHERLTDLRHEKKLTQAQAAEKLKVSKADWIAMEHGHLSVGQDLLAKLSAQGWDMAYLLMGIRQGFLRDDKPLRRREANLLNKLEHASDSDWAAIEHLANLIENPKRISLLELFDMLSETQQQEVLAITSEKERLYKLDSLMTEYMKTINKGD
jgi:transcriptional regulator with XRE-family HTH domain